MSSTPQDHGSEGAQGEPTPPAGSPPPQSPPEGGNPPPPQPPPQQQQSQSGSGETGLDPKVGGLLAYLLFGWIGGLIMFFTQKHPEVRFHGAQSVLLSIALFVFWVALTILSIIFGIIPGLGFVTSILSFLATVVVGIGAFVLWIFLCIKGYNLEHFKLPFIGDMAEKWAASQ